MINPKRSPVDLGFIRWQSGAVSPLEEDGPGAGANHGTVLLVDDNPHLREISSAMLRHHGYRPIAAADGLEAIHIARRVRPDVIVMDIDMPRMDGLEATRTIRRDPLLGSVPVVVLTAHREAAYLQRAVQAGCTSYLMKPFNPRELVIEIRRILEPARAPRPSALPQAG